MPQHLLRLSRAFARSRAFALSCAFAFALAFAPGCADGSAPPGPSMHAEAASIEGHTDAPTPRVDTIFAMDTMIARFQSQLPLVTTLDATAPRSLDELIDRFVAAVAAGSAEDLRALTMSAAEFAHLYFPTSIYSRAPYAQPPEVNWLLLEQNSRKGEVRLMREFGGRDLAVAGYRCTGEPRTEGENRIREQCLLHIRTAAGDSVEARLFGSIIERGGRFKLMSLANRL